MLFRSWLTPRRFITHVARPRVPRQARPTSPPLPTAIHPVVPHMRASIPTRRVLPAPPPVRPTARGAPVARRAAPALLGTGRIGVALIRCDTALNARPASSRHATPQAGTPASASGPGGPIRTGGFGRRACCAGSVANPPAGVVRPRASVVGARNQKAPSYHRRRVAPKLIPGYRPGFVTLLERAGRPRSKGKPPPRPCTAWTLSRRTIDH